MLLDRHSAAVAALTVFVIASASVKKNNFAMFAGRWSSWELAKTTLYKMYWKRRISGHGVANAKIFEENLNKVLFALRLARLRIFLNRAGLTSSSRFCPGGNSAYQNPANYT
jgi:hypothetical protein